METGGSHLNGMLAEWLLVEGVEVVRDPRLSPRLHLSAALLAGERLASLSSRADSIAQVRSDGQDVELPLSTTRLRTHLQEEQTDAGAGPDAPGPRKHATFCSEDS